MNASIMTSSGSIAKLRLQGKDVSEPSFALISGETGCL